MAEQYTVLDFDETLYNKDSLITIYRHFIRSNPVLLLWAPLQFSGFVLHQLKLISTSQFKNIFMLFFSFYSIRKIEKLAAGFWEKEFPASFNPELLQVVKDNKPVVVITASPLIYLTPLIRKFPGIIFIGTRLKNNYGLYLIEGKNCKGEEKLIQFHLRFGKEASISSAYSDSITDQPLFDAAAHAYMIEKGMIRKLH